MKNFIHGSFLVLSTKYLEKKIFIEHVTPSDPITTRKKSEKLMAYCQKKLYQTVIWTDWKTREREHFGP